MKTFSLLFITIVSITLTISTFGQDSIPTKYYSLLYQKNMIPKPDSVVLFDSYIVPYESMTMTSGRFRGFSLGATHANYFKRHTFGAEISLPYLGESLETYEKRTFAQNSRLKYVSKNYNQKRYRVHGIQLSWKYLLKTKKSPFVFFAYKNAPVPNDSVPVLEGEKQTRYYLRGGLQYMQYPKLIKMTFLNDVESPFPPSQNNFLLFRNRTIAFNIGAERIKEHNTSASVDRIKFRTYRQLKYAYVDLVFQPFSLDGRFEIFDSVTVSGIDDPNEATSTDMEKVSRDYIKEKVLTGNNFGLRIGYGYRYLFNSPIGLQFETGILTGVNSIDNSIGYFYSKIRLTFDIDMKPPLRTEGIAW